MYLYCPKTRNKNDQNGANQKKSSGKENFIFYFDSLKKFNLSFLVNTQFFKKGVTQLLSIYLYKKYIHVFEIK